MAIISQHPAFGSAKPAIREFPINDSGFLVHVKYDPSNLMCTVTMRSGGEYTYYMIFPMVIDQWMQAVSKGTFYAKNIRGKYRSQRLINKTTTPRGGKNGKHASSAGDSRPAHRGRSGQKGH